MHKRSLTHRRDTVVRRRSHQASTTFSGPLPLNPSTDCSFMPNTRNARSSSLSAAASSWALLASPLCDSRRRPLITPSRCSCSFPTNPSPPTYQPRRNAFHSSSSSFRPPLHCKVPAPDSRYTPHSLSPPLAQDPESPSPAQSSTIPAVYPHDSNTMDSCSSGNASNALRQPESISPARGSSGYRCSPPGTSFHPV